MAASSAQQPVQLPTSCGFLMMPAPAVVSIANRRFLTLCSFWAAIFSLTRCEISPSMCSRNDACVHRADTCQSTRKLEFVRRSVGDEFSQVRIGRISGSSRPKFRPAVRKTSWPNHPGSIWQDDYAAFRPSVSEACLLMMLILAANIAYTLLVLLTPYQ